jgi:hypothetical protein
VDGAGALPAGDALGIVNMIRAANGLRTRSGYREWVTGINSGGEVRTILPFQGSVALEDRLFAAAGDGIYDCSSSTATPSLVYTFPTPSSSSGLCTGRGFTTVAGGHYLLVCDEENGYIHYNETGDTWTLVPAGAGAGEINGVDPRDLVFVTAHKARLWFVERDTASAWYLAPNAITGTVAEFDFGPQFKHGGHLVGLWSWSRDGGAGPDDYLVAVSSGGDVVVYRGTDPASASTWEIVGVFYVGAVPAGRRIATDNGGDLLILSSLGVLPVSQLLSGADVANEAIYTTRKIQPAIGSIMGERTGLGWSIQIHPEDRTLVVNTPAVSGEDREQWVMSLGARGWAQHTGLPMTCGASWKGKFYIGTDDGRVCINDGDVDNNQLTGSTNATAIEWSMLSDFAMGDATRRIPVMVRPRFITDGTSPQYTVAARFDFDQAEVPAVTYVAQTGAGLWDSAIWDSAVWGTGAGTAGEWRGVSGMGSAVAVALRGASVARTTLVGLDTMWRSGGPL